MKRGKFECVLFVFLVRGYTKNTCDPIFNLLKLYVSSHVCTLNQLKSFQNTKDNVEAYIVNYQSFNNFNDILDN